MGCDGTAPAQPRPHTLSRPAALRLCGSAAASMPVPFVHRAQGSPVNPLSSPLTRLLQGAPLRPVALSGLALLCSAAAPVLAQDSSRIARVTVYPGSATVERVARVPAGARSLTLACLPASLDAQSLQINADPVVRVGEFNVLTEDRDVVSACASPLDGRIRELEDQIAGVKAEVSALQLVDSYLRSVAGSHVPDDAAPARSTPAPGPHRSPPRPRCCASPGRTPSPAPTSSSASSRRWSWP